MTSEKHRALLIVEDDLALQKQIKWSLDRFESVTAHDRESALVQARRHQPAVVTMDLGLPPDPDSVSEGFKLLEQLLAIDGDMKVIVLTGQNDRSNALRAVAMGAYDFFAKPFEPELLNLTVERAFRLAELQAENKRLQLMRAATPLCCCWAKAVPAKNCWRAACMKRPSARAASSSRSIAPPFPRTCSKVNCSVMKRARLPARPR
jgi:DNA-binding NtrC family response regulator